MSGWRRRREPSDDGMDARGGDAYAEIWTVGPDGSAGIGRGPLTTAMRRHGSGRLTTSLGDLRLPADERRAAKAGAPRGGGDPSRARLSDQHARQQAATGGSGPTQHAVPLTDHRLRVPRCVTVKLHAPRLSQAGLGLVAALKHKGVIGSREAGRAGFGSLVQDPVGCHGRAGVGLIDVNPGDVTRQPAALSMTMHERGMPGNGQSYSPPPTRARISRLVPKALAKSAQRSCVDPAALEAHARSTRWACDGRARERRAPSPTAISGSRTTREPPGASLSL
jgi:hypothetical protein